MEVFAVQTITVTLVKIGVNCGRLLWNRDGEDAAKSTSVTVRFGK